jgi:hypothetical protein
MGFTNQRVTGGARLVLLCITVKIYQNLSSIVNGGVTIP